MMLLSPSPFHAFSPALRHPFDLLDELERNTMRSLSIESDETDDAYALSVAVPGVRPADLEVSFVGRKLRVAAKNSRGTFERQLTLPKDADPAASKATIEHGVLTLEVPKLASKQLRVEAGEPPEPAQDAPSYTISVECVGVRTADLKVEVQGSAVAVSGRSERAGHKYQVKRRFELPSDADADAAAATHQDGVLTLTVPRTAAPNTAKRLKIAPAAPLPEPAAEPELEAAAAAEPEAAAATTEPEVDGEAAEVVPKEQ